MAIHPHAVRRSCQRDGGYFCVLYLARHQLQSLKLIAF